MFYANVVSNRQQSLAGYYLDRKTNSESMFNEEEKKRIADKEFFIAKKNITQKVYVAFEDVKKEIESHINTHLDFIPSKIIATGKINRGENLNGLPWINLDYPGFFQKENVFAIRYLFWWGNHFSITLHLGGEYLKMFNNLAFEKLKHKSGDTFYWCVNSTPWKYDYSPQNYYTLSNISDAQLNKSFENGFIKISTCFPLNQVSDFKTAGIESAKKLLALVHNLTQ